MSWVRRNKLRLALIVGVFLLTILSGTILILWDQGRDFAFRKTPPNMSSFQNLSCEVSGLPAPVGVWTTSGKLVLVTPTPSSPSYYQATCLLPSGIYEVAKGCVVKTTNPPSNVAITGKFVVESLNTQSAAQAQIVVLCDVAREVIKPLHYISNIPETP